MTESLEGNVNTYSHPSKLEITDLRVVNLRRISIVRIDTNQGISGYGEVRDGASSTYAMMLKNRIMGENPCNIDKIFRKVKQFGHHARQAGGVCAIEMALMDLAGKAYGVPAYMLAGGKFRDKILCYSDTPSERDGKALGQAICDLWEADSAEEADEAVSDIEAEVENLEAEYAFYTEEQRETVQSGLSDFVQSASEGDVDGMQQELASLDGTAKSIAEDASEVTQAAWDGLRQGLSTCIG